MNNTFRVAVLLVVVFGASWYALNGPANMETYAMKAVAECAQLEDSAGCYEKEIPNMYPEFSVKEIMAVVREIRSIDSGYQFCHVLAHKLGERVVSEDPNLWVEAIALNPADGMCSNGFIHGVVGGRFRAEVLDEESLEKLVPDFAKPMTGGYRALWTGRFVTTDSGTCMTL
jgi:hypothetical protein